MSFERCPACHLPLTDDELRQPACPACGAALPEHLAAPNAPPVASRPTMPRMETSYGPIVAGVVILLLAAGGLWFAFQPTAPAKPEATNSADRQAQAALPPPPAPPREEPASKKEAERAPEREQKKSAAPRAIALLPTAKAAQHPPLASVKNAPVAVAIASPPSPRPEQRGALVVGNEHLVRLPDSEYTLPDLRGGAHVVVKGKVRTLRVGKIEGGASLDTTGLIAKEIIFNRAIVGGSRVTVRAPSGVVEFRGRVDESSHVAVDAPHGRVSFSQPTVSATVAGSKIGGGSEVNLTAQDVHFRGLIAASAKIVVTLTHGGSLAVYRADGRPTVEYRRFDPADPEPRLLASGTKVQFRRVD